MPNPDTTIVVQILGLAGQQPTFKINDETYSKADIPARLLRIFSVRKDKVLFVKGAAEVDYGEVASIIDAGRHAGVDDIGIITPEVELGQ